VPKLPGVRHLDAVRALEKAGFHIARQGKHIVLTNGVRTVTIPRHNPVNAFTMGRIIQDAGLSLEDFRQLLG
jgi:predicted RNA binding protein YcfA (HicA-like mRNA interferase family)